MKKENIKVSPSTRISYIILYTLEGHKTWRVGIFPTKEIFDIYLQVQEKHPKVTDRKWYVVDKINGTIIEEK